MTDPFSVSRRRLLGFSRLAVLGLLPPAALMAGSAPARAAGIETKAKAVHMVDAETGTVLFSLNADAPLPPASLTKLMTAEVVFDALKRGEISETTAYSVSEHAWRTGGAPAGTATMFAALKSEVAVLDLLKGMIVDLANDACLILAEGMTATGGPAGEAAFAAKMNARAQTLGLKSATFANPTGLPNPGNRISPRDLVMLAAHLQTAYPERYPLYALADFEWNKIRQRNKNALIAAIPGVDGLAMGFAEGYGFSAVASVARAGRRVHLAIGGLASEKERVEEAKRLLEWSLTAFTKRQLFDAGETVAEASVYGGAAGTVPLVTAAPVEVLVPQETNERLSGRVVYRWPLPAPVKAGQPVGDLKVFLGERELRSVPLMTNADIGVGTLTDRSLDALKELVLFWL
ncbi:D-alanyl-D-alanine carboxypeptidase (penicillin-binding protein 5/6) [Rhizobium sp. RU20A]|uniref:D-alanyl-D-alanine carboxypeptidase family protein n=1 Tax=Rhizobium sp. RU20A TaxID=1907412 RepID=UPI000953A67E|nr:D-alanyl-D-alanine carboxypeptidase family protein [Rhizobium sp. RU20A]SIQ08516.1 D-alanyl-D-alanine carboxypeptidase (penicillin-binding protein 5/6) [Rhizobium sp. RU20A]